MAKRTLTHKHACPHVAVATAMQAAGVEVFCPLQQQRLEQFAASVLKDTFPNARFYLNREDLKLHGLVDPQFGKVFSALCRELTTPAKPKMDFFSIFRQPNVTIFCAHTVARLSAVFG